MIHDMEGKGIISIEYDCGTQRVPGVLFKLYHLAFLPIIQGKEYSLHFANKELEAIRIQVSEQRSYNK